MLGYLNPDYFVGGAMAIDLKAAEGAMRPLADRTGLSVTALAWGIHDLVNENMANAARVHIAEHGKDSRRYTLLATGGAGPVHAYYLAKKLGLMRLIAPPAAGVASALGLLIAPARADRVATVARELNAISWPELEATFARLEAEALQVLTVTLPDRSGATISRLADIRYVGQAFELVVPLPLGPYTEASRDVLRDAFCRSYVAAFSRAPPTTQMEIINVRVNASLEAESHSAPTLSLAADALRQSKGTRPAYFPELGGFHETRVYDRYGLSAGQLFDGPAIVEERDSTLLIGPSGRFEVLASGNIVVTVG
jgi:N-methylhydantoinase A